MSIMLYAHSVWGSRIGELEQALEHYVYSMHGSV